LFSTTRSTTNDWQPLQPIGVERNGRVVTVHFHVPIPPLNWDTSFDAPAITEWAKGRGLFVGYALTSQGVQLKNHSKAVCFGQLRDSDPFTGITTKLSNPNYCVSFELPVP
jgi:hypothetical protein